MERIDELIKIKRNIFDAYHKELIDCKEIKLYNPPEYCTSNYAYTIGILKSNVKYKRDRLIKEMIQRNIYVRPGYPSMSLMPNYSRRFDVTNSDNYFKYGIVLPTAMNLTNEDIHYVANNIKEALKELS